MSKTMMNRPTTRINIFNTLWDLLSQWKAMVIFALLISLLATGYKYTNDTKAYEEQVESIKRSEEMLNGSVETQISDILESLPEDKVSAVEYMVQQKEWVREEKDYVNHSILMQENPTNQRTLLLDYYLSSEDSSEMVLTSLAYGYESFFTNDTIISGIRDVINPNIDEKYIAELITAPNKGEYINSSDNGDVILEAKIVLPESTDAVAVEKIITSALTDYSAELNKTIGPHTISLIRSNEVRLFNSVAVNTRNTIIVNVYSTETYIKNMEGALDPEQKAAVESIIAIKNTFEKKADIENVKGSVAEKPEKPGINKKTIIGGFFGGVFLYAALYLIVIIFKGCIMSPDIAVTYTGSRLLGDVYHPVNASGIGKLFYSNMVNKIRYHNSADEETQITKTISTIGSVCQHAEVKNISIISFASAYSGEIVNKLFYGINDLGITASVIDVSDEIDEKKMLPVRDAICVVERGTKQSLLWNVTELCNEYDINQLGIIFINI